MKYGFSLFLLCIVMAAGVAIWLLGIDPIRSFRSANGIVRQEPQPSADASVHPKAKQAAKPTRPRIPQTRAVIEPATTQEVPAVAPIVTGDQIATATQKETIVKNGNLALSIRRVDHGHDLESLVYTRDRGREVTIISLEDGKVSWPRSHGHTSALLTDPAALHSASIAIAPPAAAPRHILKALNDTLTELPTASKPRDRTSAEANLGTCGEYRDGKVIVKPCSQVPLSPSEWLAKGSGATVAESGVAKRK